MPTGTHSQSPSEIMAEMMRSIGAGPLSEAPALESQVEALPAQPALRHPLVGRTIASLTSLEAEEYVRNHFLSSVDNLNGPSVVIERPIERNPIGTVQVTSEADRLNEAYRAEQQPIKAIKPIKKRKRLYPHTMAVICGLTTPYNLLEASLDIHLQKCHKRFSASMQDIELCTSMKSYLRIFKYAAKYGCTVTPYNYLEEWQTGNAESTEGKRLIYIQHIIRRAESILIVDLEPEWVKRIARTADQDGISFIEIV